MTKKQEKPTLQARLKALRGELIGSRAVLASQLEATEETRQRIGRIETAIAELEQFADHVPPEKKEA